MIWDYGYVAMPMVITAHPRWQWEQDDGVMRRERHLFRRFVDKLDIPEPTGVWLPNVEYTYRNPRYHLDNPDLHPNWDEKYTENGNDTARWHQDSSGWSHIAIWATNGMTQARLPSRGDIYTPEPRHLLVIDNQQCYHRAGREGYDRNSRHFIRLGIHNRAHWTPLDKYRVA